jgi:signal transduction histidine kinase
VQDAQFKLWLQYEQQLLGSQWDAATSFNRAFNQLARVRYENYARFTSLIADLRNRRSQFSYPDVVLLAARNAETALMEPARPHGECYRTWLRGLAQLEAIGSPSLTAAYLCEFCRKLLMDGEVANSIEMCERGLYQLQFAPHDETYAELLMLLAASHCQIGLHEDGIRLCMRAEAVHVSLGFSQEFFRGANLNNCAYSLVLQQHDRQQSGAQVDQAACRSAVELATTALKVFESHSLKNSMTLALHTQARAHILLGEFEQAKVSLSRIETENVQTEFVKHAASVGRAWYFLATAAPACALSALDMAGESVRGCGNQAGIEWWDARAAVLAALGRWEEAFEAMRQCHAAVSGLDKSRGQSLAHAAQRRVEQVHSIALQFLTHDIRAPVSDIAALARIAMREPSPQSLQRIARQAETVLHMAARTIDYMRSSSAHEADFRSVDLMTILDDACEDTEAVASEKGVKLVREINGPAWIRGHSDLLRRSFTNVLTNAVRYSPPDRNVVIRLGSTRDSCTVQVIDCGIGFTTSRARALKEARRLSRQGHGLGLAFVTQTMLKHSATLRLLENTPTGAFVSIEFPSVNAPLEDETTATRGSPQFSSVESQVSGTSSR